MQKIYVNAYPNTVLVFEYLCNRVNIRANRVFVSALLHCIHNRLPEAGADRFH